MAESKATPLLPCPFGTNFCRVGDLRVYELPDSPSRHVFCGACNSCGPWGEGVEEAYRMWNTRDGRRSEDGSPTTRPWKVSESKVPGYERVISIVTPDRLAICRMDGGGSYNERVLAEVRANAELIVAAVNERDSLREALEGMVAAFDTRPEGETADITIVTQECAMAGAKQVLGWDR
jgi:hypothetical protein